MPLRPPNVSVTLDSYHTIWFQFHEELIEMAARTRADEEEPT